MEREEGQNAAALCCMLHCFMSTFLFTISIADKIITRIVLISPQTLHVWSVNSNYKRGFIVTNWRAVYIDK